MPSRNRSPLAALALIALLAAPALGNDVDQARHPAASTPALSPAAAQKSFTVPKGFEMRLFAAEPDVVNPVAMTWDTRGRLWVVELFQYPHKAKAGQPGQDRIKILEDTDNDGRADKVTVFAEGLDLATGILLGHGGVYVAQAPELLFLEDTDGDDRADRRTVLLTGFSTRDTHETVNGLTWGPDGWMYFTHGVFNYSNVRPPGDEDGEGNPFDAVVGRYHPGKRRIEVFADGTSNPWGVDFDRDGNAFVSACVIDHLFHMAPGGVYARQAGQPRWPYGYELLPSIVDHRHFRAAYAGVQILSSDRFPAEFHGDIVMGNIHGNSVNRDKLLPEGASFRSKDLPDLVRSDDGWFRPVSEQIGPDGALWIADWYDRYPCYQNAVADPAGVDRKLGRIWRLVHVGDAAGAPRPSARPFRPDLASYASHELVWFLSHRNVWQRRTARRLLSERRDPSVREALVRLATGGAQSAAARQVEARLEGLWTLHAAGLLEESVLDTLAGDPAPALRVWAARLTGERELDDPDGKQVAGARARLLRLTGDGEATVRAAVAVAAHRLARHATDDIVLRLAEHPGTAEDRLLTFLIWRALEPRVARDPGPLSDWAVSKGASALPVSAELVRRSVRRLWDAGDARGRKAALALAARLADAPVALAEGALRGLVQSAQGGVAQQSASGRSASASGPTAPEPEALPTLARFARRKEPQLSGPAQRLAARWGDRAAQARLLALASGRDARVPEAEVLQAIETLAQTQARAAEPALLAALARPRSPEVARAAVRALARVGSARTGAALLSAWKRMDPGTRAVAAESLAGRPAWAAALLEAIGKRQVVASELPVSVQRALRDSKDDRVAALVARHLPRVRQSDAERAQLIEDKRRMVMNGPVDFEDGRRQAEQTCLLCHRFLGRGPETEVGPDLTGVGRSTLHALLSNVIDPNQVIGNGYEQVTVATKDGRMVSGRLLESSPQRVVIAGMAGKEQIPRAQVDTMEVSDVSAMPEGLEGLPDEAFRNLVWYIFAPPEDPANRLRIQPGDKKLTVFLRAGGKGGKPGDKAGEWIPLIEYVTDPSLRPYLHPLRDPSGKVVLTDDRPSDHVWQHGIFTGLHRVNGLDFWTEKQGQQRFLRITDIEQEPERVAWRARADWLGPDGKVVLEEEQSIAVYAPQGSDGYELDFTWRLRAKDAPVKIGKYDYGGLAVRMPYDEKHAHLNATGQTGKDTSEQRAAWTTTERSFGGETWGIAVLDHPSNELHPAKWRVDFHGLINPSPSLQGDWGMEPGTGKTFRYRVVVYRGPADKAKLDAAFERFARSGAPVAQR